VSRRDFMRLLLTVELAGAIEAFGIKINNNELSLGCPGPQVCQVPCDSRPCCKQYAHHYGPCDGMDACPSQPCGVDKRCYSKCMRWCYPNQCRCEAFQVLYSTVKCVYCEGQYDHCDSSGCQQPANCPSSIPLPET
jgi:hypothetical protein